jgi:hypothetical protein
MLRRLFFSFFAQKNVKLLRKKNMEKMVFPRKGGKNAKKAKATIKYRGGVK